ncbi:hypothetical protein [Sphingopyxis sp. USTB-05]|uniref:hypothetical protein n=1 Tax=Sphingopyxis sp. USTB-05 TaxID=2830667 RepID=UPI002078F309|nr:hypothetical protein [Sphingopyxis sp. USTB-05]USI77614.1 hypothetical protein KEC45_01475 [Sphingopyxis sp. USTB-05]
MLAAAGALASCSMSGAGSGEQLSTPPGITTVDVTFTLFASQPEYQWTRLGDDKGRSLFQFVGTEKDKAACTGKCRAQFQPLVAPEDAGSYKSWSLVDLANGKQQWSYRGRPLYTWKKETEPGAIAENIVCKQRESAKLAEFNTCSIPKDRPLPPKGWRLVRYEPTTILKTPPFIAVQRVANVSGNTLVDGKGATIYEFTGDVEDDNSACENAKGRCLQEWSPVLASALAQDVGPITTIARADGTRQWAFNGNPLYTYSSDRQPGDAKGAGRETSWHVAMVQRDFAPANVKTQIVAGRGAVLATSDGHTLYTRHPFEFRWGGRNARNGFNNDYATGKKLGAGGCDKACLAEWQPFLAPSDAVSSGYWEVYKRKDGKKQWAYKGYALYTRKGEKPGVVSANNVYDYIVGKNDRYSFEEAGVQSGFGGGAGLFWHAAIP